MGRWLSGSPRVFFLLALFGALPAIPASAQSTGSIEGAVTDIADDRPIAGAQVFIAALGIGAVTGVQGISWTEINITGQSNHAGTTPMSMRRDAGLAAGELVVAVRRIASEMGGTQVGTVGALRLHPDLVNVVAARAQLSSTCATPTTTTSSPLSGACSQRPSG